MTYGLLHLPKEGETKTKSIDLPNVLYHNPAKSGGAKIHFFRGMPSVGAYLALPITLASGEVVGFLAVDTMLESGKGSGEALSADDKVRVLSRL